MDRHHLFSLGQNIFTWVYYLRAVGLVANNNNRDDSPQVDLWNWMTPQVITAQSGTSVFSLVSHSDVFPNPAFDYIQILDLHHIPTIQYVTKTDK